MTGVAPGWEQGPGLPAPGVDGGAASASARSAAASAYQELGWPVTLRGEQVSLNLDLDLDAVAVVIPVGLAAHVVQILVGRRCPPPVLVHPALVTHRVIVAGERFGVPLGWPDRVHRVTGILLLPPTVTEHGPVQWERPPRSHALRWCREVDVVDEGTSDHWPGTRHDRHAAAGSLRSGREYPGTDRRPAAPTAGPTACCGNPA